MKGRGKKQPVKTDVIAAGLSRSCKTVNRCRQIYLRCQGAGHDKDVLYVVLAQEGSYLWLADGKRRSLASPKKKKQMHVQLITHLPEITSGADAGDPAGCPSEKNNQSL